MCCEPGEIQQQLPNHESGEWKLQRRARPRGVAVSASRSRVATGHGGYDSCHNISASRQAGGATHGGKSLCPCDRVCFFLFLLDSLGNKYPPDLVFVHFYFPPTMTLLGTGFAVSLDVSMLPGGLVMTPGSVINQSRASIPRCAGIGYSGHSRGADLGDGAAAPSSASAALTCKESAFLCLIKYAEPRKHGDTRR